MDTLIIICIVIAIVCFGGVWLMDRKRREKVSHLNAKVEIPIGKYLAGFENYSTELGDVYCYVSDDVFLFTSAIGDEIGTIKLNSITNIILEDKTSVGQRLTATRILALGIFSLAAPKKKKDKEFCIIFEWEDENGEKHNAVFEFSGKDSKELSTETFNILKKYKPITTKKCRFCDEIIKIKATVCKHCNKELS